MEPVASAPSAAAPAARACGWRSGSASGINVERVEEALSDRRQDGRGACPFCLTMLGDGVTGKKPRRGA